MAINIETQNQKMRSLYHAAGHTGSGVIIGLFGTGVNRHGILAEDGYLIAGNDQAFEDHIDHDTGLAYLYRVWLPDAQIISYNVFPDGKDSIDALKAAMRDFLARAKADRDHLYMGSMSLSGSDLKDDEIDELGQQLTAARAMTACSAGNTGSDASAVSYPGAYAWPYTGTNTTRSGKPGKKSSRIDTADFADWGERVLVMTADGSFAYRSGTSISIVQMWAKAGLLQCCYHDQTGLWWEDERLYAEMKARAVDLSDNDWDEETGWGVVIGTPTAYETTESDTAEEKEEKALSNLVNNEFDFVVDTGLAWAGTLSKLDRLDVIVIHHSASDGSTIQSIHKYHLSEGHKGCDYNYVIETDGTIHLGRGLLYEGGHVGNAKSNYLNAHSCGICLVGAIHKHEPTAAQVASAIKLISAILALNGQTISGVEINVTTIYGHREVPYYVNGKLTGDAYPTVCPGAYMPMDEFKALLTGGTAEEEPQEEETLQPAIYAYAGATGVNVRSGPGSACAKIGNLSADEQCIVLSRSNGWAKVILHDQDPVLVGYCIDTYLVEEDESDPVALYTYKGASYVNLRDAPGGVDIGDVNAGDEVLVLQLKDGWAEVIKHNDAEPQRCWCIDTYLKKV